MDRLKRDLGPLWEYLPAGALNHDPNAYLKKVDAAGGPAQPGQRQSSNVIGLAAGD